MVRRVFAALLVLLLAGCFGGPDPADLGEGGPLVERWRIPSPVIGWDFAEPALGLFGEQRRLVSLAADSGRVRWVHDLPAGFRVTASSVSVSEGILLVRGDDRFRVIDLTDGLLLWEREFEGQVVTAMGAGNDVAVTAGCDGKGCELTAWELPSGARRWSRRIGERVTVVPSPGDRYCYCVRLLGSRTILLIETDDGKTVWSMRKPSGVTRLIPVRGPQVLWTPPAEPDCVATLRGVESGKVVWTRRIATDCDVAVPSVGDDPGGNLEIPVAGGLESLSPLDGVGRTVPLEANERLIEDGPERISWTPGVGYRSIDSVDRTPAKVPPPLDGRPGAEATPVGVWVLRSGPGLVLYVPLRGTVRWSGPAPVMIVDYDRLIYRDGADLVGVGPRDGAVKGP